MSTLKSNPYSFPMGSTESLPIGIDFAANILGGETLSSPSATLTDLDAGATGGTLGVSSVAGTVVTQTVSGLTAGHTYRLVVTVTAGGKTWSTETLIPCEV